jgi:DMSO/TMAO reductase YedYZ molybdopterin-dependent catalytic subunit
MAAALRLRVERQLGYKQAKYIMRIEMVDSFARIAGGKGGYWEDRGYEWYAGIQVNARRTVVLARHAGEQQDLPVGVDNNNPLAPTGGWTHCPPATGT